jgi:uncharacterized membrane protein YhdT
MILSYTSHTVVQGRSLTKILHWIQLTFILMAHQLEMKPLFLIWIAIRITQLKSTDINLDEKLALNSTDIHLDGPPTWNELAMIYIPLLYPTLSGLFTYYDLALNSTDIHLDDPTWNELAMIYIPLLYPTLSGLFTYYDLALNSTDIHLESWWPNLKWSHCFLYE